MRREGGTTVRQAGKTLVPLLSILAALSMGVAAIAIVLQIQEREKRQTKERELLMALAEKDDLKAQLEDLQQTKSRIEEELGRVRADFATTQEKLAQTVEANEVLTRSVEARQKEIDRLAKDVEQVRTERKTLASQVGELEQEREQMQRQLTELEEAKGELEAKVLELSQGPTVELDKVLVTNDASGTAGAVGMAVPVSAVSSGPMDGQVVVVNREYDFIVMNLGKKHGLSVGQEFQIVRGSELLGRVKVEKIYDELSAAAILPDSQKDNIREGDTVRAL